MNPFSQVDTFQRNPDGSDSVGFGFGRVLNGEMFIMAPNLSLEL